MNIQNQPLSPKRAAARQSDAASGAQKVDSVERAAASTPASSQTSAAGDRVEISDAARAAQAQGQAEAQLVERGRSALREATSLDAERLASLRQRAASGYYNAPEATRQIAERLAGDLTGGGGE